jgi:hypothetical protein
MVRFAFPDAPAYFVKSFKLHMWNAFPDKRGYSLLGAQQGGGIDPLKGVICIFITELLSLPETKLVEGCIDPAALHNTLFVIIGLSVAEQKYFFAFQFYLNLQLKI